MNFLSIVTLFTLFVLIYQGFIMQKTLKEQRNQLKVNSFFNMWLNHIKNNHSPVITLSDDLAAIYKDFTPYQELSVKEARAAHFADSIFDLYEIIYLMDSKNILDKEIGDIWKKSIPYELKNKLIREHWIKYHSPKLSQKKDLIYIDEYAKYIDNIIDTFNDK